MPEIALPSRTSLTAAAARAAHLVVDQEPYIFTDPLAVELLGGQAAELLAYHRSHPEHPILAGARAEVTCRSRLAEDLLAAAVARGTGQYVVLGAGLDTFAYRSGLASSVRVFEVDHPATQAWKRQAVSGLTGAASPGLTFVPADLHRDSLQDRLEEAGFDVRGPAFVSWLGVSMYLSPAAVAETLRSIGGLAVGTELVADFLLPAHLRDEAAQAYVDGVGPVAAQSGEPWLSFLAPDEMSQLVERSGFGRVRICAQQDAVDAALWLRTDALRPGRLSMLVHAKVDG